MFHWNWYSAKCNDPRVVDLYSRHYSSRKGRADRQLWLRHGILPPGESMVLLTASADAVFAWNYQTIRDDNRYGIHCTVFRNESNLLSSKLILEAEQLALAKWGVMPLWTMVSAGDVVSKNPGYCFKKAGWVSAGKTTKGLHVLRKF